MSLLAKNEVSSDNYRISELKCIACQECVNACPVQAISVISGKAVIDQTKCIQCGICVNGNYDDYLSCPVNAIQSPQEESESSAAE